MKRVRMVCWQGQAEAVSRSVPSSTTTSPHYNWHVLFAWYSNPGYMCLPLYLGESSAFGMSDCQPLSAIGLTKRSHPLVRIVKFEAIHIDITV
jgi:hypothetical protein